MEIADFYDVSILEIIEGERKSEMMDNETKDTMKKVAAYAAEKEKGSQSRMVHAALGISITLFVCTVLFSDETAGLLYGIVPKEICAIILALVYGAAAGLLIFYLRVRWFMEKPSEEAERSVSATVVSKEVKRGTGRSGRSMMGYSFLVSFLTEDGQRLELYTYEIEFGALKEGMKGELTYKGRYFVSFQETA